jgi:hypothetical protein
MQQKEKKKEHIIMQIIDVFFVMILCFATLLTTMLMQGKVLVGTGNTAERIQYSFNAVTFLTVAGILVFYTSFVCLASNRELKDMIKFLYRSTDNNSDKVGEQNEHLDNY